MPTLKVAAVAIVVGSIFFFLVAAFSPISRVFGTPSPEAKWQLISASRNAWLLSQILLPLDRSSLRSAYSLPPRPSRHGRLPLLSMPGGLYSSSAH